MYGAVPGGQAERLRVPFADVGPIVVGSEHPDETVAPPELTCGELTRLPDAGGEAGDVKWNFEKFLLSGDGRVVGRFRPQTEPDDPTLRAAIESVLPA